jgi:hypothetical protein
MSAGTLAGDPVMRFSLRYESYSQFWHRWQSFVKAVLLLRHNWRPIMIHWRVQAKLSAKVVDVIYVGEGESLQYFQGLFGTKVISEQSSHLPVRGLKERLNKICAGQEVVIIELNRLVKNILPTGGKITYPWIRQRVDLRGALYKSSRSRLHATYGRMVRKYRYTVRETHDQADMLQFYRMLYLDYIHYRHLRLTHARSLEELLYAGSHGCLLQVYSSGKWVSGVLCRLHGDSVIAVAFGVAAPYAENLRKGAMSAAYYFLFGWAEERKLRSVDLLRSRADRNDGIYEHKRRWGAEASPDRWCHTVIGLYNSDTDEAAKIFSGLISFPQ